MTARAWDVVVAGGGPAGSTAARALALRGASVLLLDRGELPRWKVCGACLSPGAQDALAAAGLGGLPCALGAVPLDRLTLAAAGRSASLPLAGTVALSRAALDRALADAAASAGACVRVGATASLGTATGSQRVVVVRWRGRAERHTARVVVDATGLGGGLGGATGVAERQPYRVAPGSRIGLGAVFDAGQVALPRGELRMVAGAHGYVGMVRVEDGRVNVAAAVEPDAVRRRGPGEAVAEILAESGLEALPASPALGWRGTPTLTRRPTELGGARLLRLGDAAGYVEPFTGEGICWALDSALVAAELAARGARDWRPEILEAWRVYHAGSLERARVLCRLLAWGLRRPRLVSNAVRVLGRAPAVARPLVSWAAGRPRPTSQARGA